MKAYTKLCLQGEKSIPDKKIVLQNRRKLLLSELQELNCWSEYIDTKQKFYDDVLSGKIKYISNLVKISGVGRLLNSYSACSF